MGRISKISFFKPYQTQRGVARPTLMPPEPTIVGVKGRSAGAGAAAAARSCWGGAGAGMGTATG